VRPGERSARLTPGVGEKLERPACGDRRVQLAQGASRGVARIGENRFPGGGALFVQREETGALEIDLAANVDLGGPASTGEHLRHGVERAKVRRDIFAGCAITARCPENEAAVLVGERNRKPIDLGLGHDLDSVLADQLFGGSAAKEIAHAREKVADIGLFECVFQRQHRPRMGDLGKARGRGGSDPASRAVGADQLRKARLDLAVASAQRVVIGIGDLRCGVRVVKPIVMRDFLG